MAISELIGNAKACCEHIIEELGFELVDVEYIREDGQMCLNFYIYKEDGVSVEDCEKVSREIDPAIEAADPTEGRPYCLCVSSPGEHPFKTDRDYQRNIGSDVEIILSRPLEGKKKKFKGRLAAFDKDTVTLQTEKETLQIAREQIQNIKPYIGF